MRWGSRRRRRLLLNQRSNLSGASGASVRRPLLLFLLSLRLVVPTPPRCLGKLCLGLGEEGRVG